MWIGGQGLSASRSANTIAPTTTANKMILVFTGLSFRFGCQNSPAGRRVL
jgi:hypothetical protein